MPPPANTERDKHHRLPGASISHGVWLSANEGLIKPTSVVIAPTDDEDGDSDDDADADRGI